MKYDKEKPDHTIVLIGGTGFFEDGGRDLHPEVEHTKPDYTLYQKYVDSKIEAGRARSYFDDYLNYSIGFTSRGCFRKCHFCVNKKYSRAMRHAHVSEFLDEKRPMIYLWDDNIFALANEWQEVFDELDATGKPFQFRQGLDIRLLKEEHAKRLMASKYHGDIIFAFDHVDQAELIEKKLILWRSYCSKTTKLYVLCAFDPWDYEVMLNNPEGDQRHYFLDRMNAVNTQDERDQLDILGVFERIEILMKYGCLPYIMRYEKYKESKYKGVYTELARWVNQPQFFKKKSFRQFCEANRDYNKSEDCASYKAMKLFEIDCPEVANKYFDMRFDEKNCCEISHSFGRLDTIPCFVCESRQCTWSKVTSGNISEEFILKDYYSGKLDFLCLLTKKHPHCQANTELLARNIAAILKNTAIETIICLLDQIGTRPVLKSEIPQFSTLKTGIEDGMLFLCDHPYTFIEFGSVLPGRSSETTVAKQKYGENYAKLLSQLDLAWIDSEQHPNVVRVSPLGKYLQDNPDLKLELIPKLILKIPLIQNILRDLKSNERKIDDYLQILGKSTITRRRYSVNQLLYELHNMDSVLIDARFNRLRQIDF